MKEVGRTAAVGDVGRTAAVLEVGRTAAGSRPRIRAEGAPDKKAVSMQ